MINIKIGGQKILKVDFNKKYNTISVYCIVTFAICLLMVIVCINFPAIAVYIKKFFKVIAPITWGVAIAYICNPIMKFTENLLSKVTDRKKPHKKLTRAVSVGVSVLLLIAIIVALVWIVVNQISESILEILNSIPDYIGQLESLVVKFLGDYPDAVKAIESQLDTIQPRLMDFANDLIPKLGDFSVKVKDRAIDVLIAIKDFVIGFIVAIYLLLSKEQFLAQGRKITYAIFPKSVGKNVLKVCSKANSTLSGFLSGKLLDSFIIGAACFICMTIMKMEFTTLISVIIGVTNIIPFFGPLIGAIPSAFLLLLANPQKVIPFVAFIIILQQVDGNIIGPKILGDSTGLSPFWVMFAILVGGGLFGIIGMLLGVPLFAVLYAMFSEFIASLLKKRKLSHRTVDYNSFDLDNPPGTPIPPPVAEESAAAVPSDKK